MTMFIDIELRKPVACPWCKHVLVGGSIMDQEEGQQQPRGGNVTFCFSCGKLSIYVGTAELRKPLYEEFQEIIKDPKVITLFLAWKAFQYVKNK